MNKKNPIINFEKFSTKELKTMAEAGLEVVECHRVLAKTGDNIVRELLPKEETFYQFDHCPPGDIIDYDSHSQFYYHAHREGEHGHFHIFMREKGMPKDCRPAKQSKVETKEKREDKICHLVAISMDRYGIPIRLFTVNRWVTGENWYNARDVYAMVERFQIDQTKPSWVVNRWVTALLWLFRPQIRGLLEERDAVIAKWKKKYPGKDVFEDRDLGLPSMIEISIDDQNQALLRELTRRHEKTTQTQKRKPIKRTKGSQKQRAASRA